MTFVCISGNSKTSNISTVQSCVVQWPMWQWPSILDLTKSRFQPSEAAKGGRGFMTCSMSESLSHKPNTLMTLSAYCLKALKALKMVIPSTWVQAQSKHSQRTIRKPASFLDQCTAMTLTYVYLSLPFHEPPSFQTPRYPSRALVQYLTTPRSTSPQSSLSFF
jgi:hypothetical protein